MYTDFSKEHAVRFLEKKRTKLVEDILEDQDHASTIKLRAKIELLDELITEFSPNTTD